MGELVFTSRSIFDSLTTTPYAVKRAARCLRESWHCLTPNAFPALCESSPHPPCPSRQDAGPYIELSSLLLGDSTPFGAVFAMSRPLLSLKRSSRSDKPHQFIGVRVRSSGQRLLKVSRVSKGPHACRIFFGFHVRSSRLSTTQPIMSLRTFLSTLSTVPIVPFLGAHDQTSTSPPKQPCAGRVHNRLIPSEDDIVYLSTRSISTSPSLALCLSLIFSIFCQITSSERKPVSVLAVLSPQTSVQSRQIFDACPTPLCKASCISSTS